MAKLDGRVAIVTGGGHGLGRAYSHALAKENAAVLVADLDGSAAERVADEIAELGRTAHAVSVDVAKEDQTEGMVRTAVEKFGRVDALVNNAAIFQTVRTEQFESTEKITLEEWNRVMSVNVAGVFLCSRAAIPQMKAQNYGKIVNISSTTALQGLFNLSPYMVSKAAVIGITRGLARELGAWNITVNTIAPGVVLSYDDVTEEMVKTYEDRMNSAPTAGRGLSGAQIRAIRRIARVDDLTGTVVYLCSPDSDFVSGQMITVDGGSYMN